MIEQESKYKNNSKQDESSQQPSYWSKVQLIQKELMDIQAIINKVNPSPESLEKQ